MDLSQSQVLWDDTVKQDFVLRVCMDLFLWRLVLRIYCEQPALFICRFVWEHNVSVLELVIKSRLKHNMPQQIIIQFNSNHCEKLHLFHCVFLWVFFLRADLSTWTNHHYYLLHSVRPVSVLCLLQSSTKYPSRQTMLQWRILWRESNPRYTQYTVQHIQCSSVYIQVVTTHWHTNAEQMSSVQFGLNEPWMIRDASGDACVYLFRGRMWLGPIWYQPPSLLHLCFRCHGRVGKQITIITSTLALVPTWCWSRETEPVWAFCSPVSCTVLQLY